MISFIIPQTTTNNLSGESSFVSPSIIRYLQQFPIPHIVSPLDIVVLDLVKTYSLDILKSIVMDEPLSVAHMKGQTVGGNYICRLSDSHSPEFLQELFKISACYKRVYICKPLIEDPASSIKYVVATDFISPLSSLNIVIPYYFRMKLDEINIIYGQIQLEHLRNRLN